MNTRNKVCLILGAVIVLAAIFICSWLLYEFSYMLSIYSAEHLWVAELAFVLTVEDLNSGSVFTPLRLIMIGFVNLACWMVIVFGIATFASIFYVWFKATAITVGQRLDGYLADRN